MPGWTTPDTIASILTTELNSLANATMSSVSSAITNESGLYLLSSFQIDVTYGSAPTAGGYVALYRWDTLDGTNYATANVAYSQALLGVFPLNAVTTQQIITLDNILIPPLGFKVSVYNGAGQAMPASGSTVKYRRHNIA